jgi:2-iminoacetate synthase ThiH
VCVIAAASFVLHRWCCRGIVEFSNVCQNDCGYCGIRKHMGGVKRYTIPIDEVVEVAKWAFENRMGTLMLQSGEWMSLQGPWLNADADRTLV